MAEGRLADVGFGFAAMGLVLMLLAWSSAPPERAIAGGGGLIAAAVGTLAFSGRRHDRIGRVWASMLAGVAGVLLAAAAVAILLIEPAIGWPGYLVGVAGIGCVAVAAIDGGVVSPTRARRQVRIVLVGGAIGFGGLFVAGLLATMPEAIGGAAGIEFGTVTGAALRQAGLGIGLALAALGFVLGTGRGMGYFDVAMPERRGIAWMVGGIVLTLGAAIAIGLLYWFIGVEIAEHELARRGREEGAEIVLVAIPITLFVTAVGEELLYRNGIQKYFREHARAWVAIGGTSIIFALAHIPALIAPTLSATVPSLILIFLLSLILGGIYERTSNVIVPIVIHGVYNAFVFANWYLDLAGTM